ncbi:MAG: polymer-forming cytoskeletal protein [Spirochaetia bacterium]|nr:polymer-forming cytoskeletal protein [Spirochaetia bacterium]
MAKPNETNSIIGEGSVFEGKFYISGSLKVDGKFEGDIHTDETLVIGETGKVKTNIKAERVVLAGTLIGDIQAREEVRLTETGRMMGNIDTPVLNLSRGVVFKGSVNISGGQKKEIQKIIEESFGGPKEIDKKAAV